MNPKKKSEFQVVQLKVKQMFECIINDLKQQLLLELKEKIADPIEQLGYIEPGWHGLRAKQRWLSSDDDLEQMYSLLKQKPYEVNLWCFAATGGRGVKRCRCSPVAETETDKPTKAPRTSYEKHIDKVAQADENEKISCKRSIITATILSSYACGLTCIS